MFISKENVLALSARIIISSLLSLKLYNTATKLQVKQSSEEVKKKKNTRFLKKRGSTKGVN